MNKDVWRIEIIKLYSIIDAMSRVYLVIASSFQKFLIASSMVCVLLSSQLHNDWEIYATTFGRFMQKKHQKNEPLCDYQRVGEKICYSSVTG